MNDLTERKGIFLKNTNLARPFVQLVKKKRKRQGSYANNPIFNQVTNLVTPSISSINFLEGMENVWIAQW